MRIESVKIKNFRGYSEEVNIPFDDLTVFVGKNDVGKSTVLEALDVFFNDGKGPVKMEKDDLNIVQAREGNVETTITVIFSELPERLVIDATTQTVLTDEYLLNHDGYLEIIKKYKNGGSAKVYVRALHPTNTKCSDLLLKKNADLKKIINENNITCQNLTINSCLRHAIWDYFSNDLQLDEVEIDASKDDAKILWDKLAQYMPVYSLFQVDRKNSDGDSEVQDPLKEAVKEILQDAQLQASLSSIANEVSQKLQEVSDRTLEKLREMDDTVASSLNPVIPSVESLKWQDVFKNVSIFGDGDIPINKRGSGVKRLVLLSFFRGEVERRTQAGESSGVIYAIEEPETSQHTNNQKKLIDALKTLSEMAGVQVILTTHSSFIVKNLDYTNLRIIKDDDGNYTKQILTALPGQLQYTSLNEVNYTAFGDVTEEYHNELFGFIEYQGWKKDYFSGKPTRLYVRDDKGILKNEQRVLSDYIRNMIHHPENHYNVMYTHEELLQSINDMRDYIQNKRDNNDISEPINYEA